MRITKPFSFNLADGTCKGCGKKLPKDKKYWCDSYCANLMLDQLMEKFRYEDRRER